MKIFFSKTQNAGDVSESCAASMGMWGHDGNNEVTFEDENVVVLKDCSYDSWSSRLGVIVKSKKDDTLFTMHFTGMGFGWGKIEGKIEGNLLIIPTGLDVDGRTVYDTVKKNPKWCEFSHPLFYGLGEGYEYNTSPMVPFKVGH